MAVRKTAGLENLNDEQKLKTGVTVGSGIGGLETIYDGSITINQKGAKKTFSFFYPIIISEFIIRSNFY